MFSDVHSSLRGFASISPEDNLVLGSAFGDQTVTANTADGHHERRRRLTDLTSGRG